MTTLELSERYAIEREIGRGGTATVYLARDLRHDRQVAIKVLEPYVAPSGADRFLREIRIAARLTHPHVLGLHDSGEAADSAGGRRLFYVMPYVEGETLRSRLTRDGALPVADAVRLLREMADALAYAHGHGVVHRDLKPENVLLTGAGPRDTSGSGEAWVAHAVVADFGIARAIAAATGTGTKPNDRITATGIAVGTPAYMAPEQAIGDVTLDHRADLYALGLIAYEMLTGTHPFAGRTGAALARAHLTEPPPPLAKRRMDVPPAVASLVMKLLAKDPSARPQNATDVLRVLEGLSPMATSTPARRRRHTPVAIAIAAVVVAGVAGGYSILSHRATAASAGPVAGRMVAVLPFTNTSGSPDDDYFSDGLTDELASALAHVPGVRVAGRSSSFAFKGKPIPSTEIGKALGVGAIVEGTVRRSGDRLRVTTQLVRASDGTVLWDSVYESRSRDVFAVQDSLTHAVVASLAPTLGLRNVRADSGVSARPVDVKRGTTDADAYELYLKGRYYWHERGAANVKRSIDYFQQAIARDPRFARAYAALAFAYEVFGVYVPDPNDTLTPLIKASALRAMTLDSTLADAQQAAATALLRDGRFAEAEMHYRAALRIEPANQFAHHDLGTLLVELGRPNEGITELREATRLDPLAKSAGTMLAEAFLDARRFREAEAEARRVLAIDSTFVLALNSLGLAQVFGGQPDSAVRTLERAVRLYPEFAILQQRLIFAYAAAGRWDDAERMRAQLRRPGGDPTGGVLSGFADLVFGDREPLMRVLATRDGQRRSIALRGMGCDPLVDPLWADERYRRRMRELGVAPCPQARPWPITPRGGK